MFATCSRKLAAQRGARGEEFKGSFFGGEEKNAERVEGRIKDANASPKFSPVVVFPPLCEGV